MRPYTFTIREAASDISGAKILGEAGSIYPVELDYALGVNASLGVVDAFITPAPIPNQTDWSAGTYTVTLQIVSDGPDVSFTCKLWRVDLLGNQLEQIGSEPALQSAGGNTSQAVPVSVSFAISGEEIPNASPTDRLLLQVLAQNTSSTDAATLGIMASDSGVVTPINAPDIATNNFNTFRRNRFLGFLWRKGDGSRFFDKNGVNLDSGGNY